MTTQTKYRKYDSESDYYAMGYRMYSAEFGRFLAVDPLFEAMPRHNPYHYSFNSPMFWSDPSGLAPVKEKVKNGEKLQAIEWNQTIFEEARDGIIAENGKRSAFVKSSNMGDYWCAKAMQPKNNFFSWNIWNAFNVFDPYIGDGGGTSGSSETARSGEEAAGENGTDQDNTQTGQDNTQTEKDKERDEAKKKETPWMTSAVGELGVEEIKGKENNDRIVEYHKTTGGWKNDEVPWCGSFVSFIFDLANIDVTMSNPALAINWSKFGDYLGKSYDKLAYGAVVVVKTSNGHHVTFCAGLVDGKESFWGLGGNQGTLIGADGISNNGVRVQYSKYKFSNIYSINYPTGYIPNFKLTKSKKHP